MGVVRGLALHGIVPQQRGPQSSAACPPSLTLCIPGHPLLQLDPGLWEVCLQDYGIYRQSAICGKYLTV